MIFMNRLDNTDSPREEALPRPVELTHGMLPTPLLLGIMKLKLVVLGRYHIGTKSLPKGSLPRIIGTMKLGTTSLLGTSGAY